ncbi:MAG: WD40 repeat-containing protein, partial [Caulobacteraceae bacterium]
AYMAPEQAQGKRAQVGPRSDVYAVGAMLYESLTGEPPFRGSRSRVVYQVVHEEPTPPRRLHSAIPVDLEVICLRAMTKEPARRYSSAAHLAADLARFLNGEPIQARPVGRVEGAWRWCRRNPAIASLLALIAALLFGAAVGSNVALVRITKERNAAEGALRTTREQLDRAAVQIGLRAGQEWGVSSTLPGFVRALELALGNPERERMHRVRIGVALRQAPRVTQACFHDGAVVAAEFSRDGALFVTASADGAARVWSTETGDAVTGPLEHGAKLTRAVFSADGRRGATASVDKTARATTARRVFGMRPSARSRARSCATRTPSTWRGSALMASGSSPAATTARRASGKRRPASAWPPFSTPRRSSAPRSASMDRL